MGSATCINILLVRIVIMNNQNDKHIEKYKRYAEKLKLCNSKSYIISS